jgi:hypothetical protein
MGKKRDIVASLSKLLGKYVSVNRVDGWKGWRFKPSAMENIEDDGIDA